MADEKQDEKPEIQTETCPMCKRQAVGNGTSFSCECGMSWTRMDNLEE